MISIDRETEQRVEQRKRIIRPLLYAAAALVALPILAFAAIIIIRPEGMVEPLRDIAVGVEVLAGIAIVFFCLALLMVLAERSTSVDERREVGYEGESGARHDSIGPKTNEESEPVQDSASAKGSEDWYEFSEETSSKATYKRTVHE